MLKFNIHGAILATYNENTQSRNYLLNELEHFLCETSKEPDISLNFVSNLKIPLNLKSIDNRIEIGNNLFYLRLKKGRVIVFSLVGLQEV